MRPRIVEESLPERHLFVSEFVVSLLERLVILGNFHECFVGIPVEINAVLLVWRGFRLEISAQREVLKLFRMKWSDTTKQYH